MNRCGLQIRTRSKLLKLCQALSEFADYVQRQQATRRPPGDADSGYGTYSKVTEEHDELDILDTLDLADESSHVQLRRILLDNSDDADESITLLTNYLNGRLVEGRNEILFDLGLEDDGDSMGFTSEDWQFAMERLRTAANAINADVRVLMTRNVGGEFEVGPISQKDRSLSGKLLIRQRPESIDDVIETRIAVVGNGMGVAV